MRAAMIGGGAYVAGKHVAAGQQREAEQEARIQELEAQQQYQTQAAAPPPPPPPPAPMAAAPAAAPAQDDLTAKLMQLKNLKDQGVLTDEEFTAAKAKLLGV